MQAAPFKIQMGIFATIAAEHRLRFALEAWSLVFEEPSEPDFGGAASREQPQKCAHAGTQRTHAHRHTHAANSFPSLSFAHSLLLSVCLLFQVGPRVNLQFHRHHHHHHPCRPIPSPPALSFGCRSPQLLPPLHLSITCSYPSHCAEADIHQAYARKHRNKHPPPTGRNVLLILLTPTSAYLSRARRYPYSPQASRSREITLPKWACLFPSCSPAFSARRKCVSSPRHLSPNRQPSRKQRQHTPSHSFMNFKGIRTQA